MTKQEIDEQRMTPERIRQITAEEVMGWTLHTAHSGKMSWQGPGVAILTHTWRPDLDRNQSRMVVEKAREILGTGDKLMCAYCDCIPPNTLVWAWIECTPLQECEVCLRALGLWERVEEALKV